MFTHIRLASVGLAVLVVMGSWSASASAQRFGYGGFAAYPGSYGYPGYFSGGYNGFYSNGFSMYGPPVPTYGPVPGYFGGADQRFYGGYYPRRGYYRQAPHSYQQTPQYQHHHATRPHGGLQPLPADLDRSVTEMPVSTGDSARPAHIEVKLPHADAKVFFNGQQTKQAGTNRNYETPPLSTGKHIYHLEASWMQEDKPVLQDRKITLTPGQRLVVDFTQPEPRDQ